MNPPEPQPEHKWLQRFVGEWTYEVEASMGCDAPAAKHTGTESVRAFGDVWVLCEGRSEEQAGQRHTHLFTLGYEPDKKRFTGSFISSMMTKMWLYDGSLAGNVLTLDSTGPSFTDPAKTAEYQDVFEIKSDDERVLWSQCKQDDGTWMKFMTMTYRRAK